MPLPSYLPCIGDGNGPRNREKLIVEYHAQGFTNFEILSFLRIHHNITISISTLKRILAKLCLRRRYPNGSENREELKQVLETELRGSTGVLGTTFNYYFP